MARYGYGLGGPAVAISEAGSSLSDLMKSFAAVKISEAKANVESKQADLGLQRAQGELEINKIKAELEGVRQAAAERHANLADVARQQQLQQQGEQMRQQGEFQKGTLGIQQGTLGVHQRELALKEKEYSRLNEVKSMEDHIKGSSLLTKDAILGEISPENRSQKVSTRDYEGFLKDLAIKKPGEILQLQAIETHQHFINAYRAFRSNPSDQTAKELMTRYLNADNLAGLITGDPQKMLETATRMAKVSDPTGDRPDEIQKHLETVQAFSKVYKHTLSADELKFSSPDELNEFIKNSLAPKPAPYSGRSPDIRGDTQPMSADGAKVKISPSPSVLGENPSLLASQGMMFDAQSGRSAKKILRTGIDRKTGKKVAEYEDGTFGYAP